MANGQFPAHEWALILGGSSGFGLAAAHKLSQHGLNVCVVHRDRRGALKRIEPEFEAIRARGVEFASYNKDALKPEVQAEILDEFEQALDTEGRVRVLMHSIAFGNLKLLAREAPSSDEATERLAGRLGLDAGAVREAADELFEAGVDGVQGIAAAPLYAADNYLADDDVARTIYAMGTSLLSWTRQLSDRGLFAEDARVLGMTSEGNEVAWKGYAAVAAAKVALESVSRSIAVEMAHMGIRSNIIQAGVTDTPALRAIPGSLNLKAQARTRNPFGRLTTPEDVAGVVYLLSLPESAWINGAIIRADGGERVSGLSR